MVPFAPLIGLRRGGVPLPVAALPGVGVFGTLTFGQVGPKGTYSGEKRTGQAPRQARPAKVSGHRDDPDNKSKAAVGESSQVLKTSRIQSESERPAGKRLRSISQQFGSGGMVRRTERVSKGHPSACRAVDVQLLHHTLVACQQQCSKARKRSPIDIQESLGPRGGRPSRPMSKQTFVAATRAVGSHLLVVDVPHALHSLGQKASQTSDGQASAAEVIGGAQLNGRVLVRLPSRLDVKVGTRCWQGELAGIQAAPVLIGQRLTGSNTSMVHVSVQLGTITLFSLRQVAPLVCRHQLDDTVFQGGGTVSPLS